MNKGFGNNLKKIKNNNYLFKETEVAPQTKKAIIFAREGNFLEAANIYNYLI